MKLTKAKEILEFNVNEAGKKMPKDTLDALKLGVEAISWLLGWRGTNSSIANVRLPGETSNDESP